MCNQCSICVYYIKPPASVLKPIIILVNDQLCFPDCPRALYEAGLNTMLFFRSRICKKIMMEELQTEVLNVLCDYLDRISHRCSFITTCIFNTGVG